MSFICFLSNLPAHPGKFRCFESKISRCRASRYREIFVPGVTDMKKVPARMGRDLFHMASYFAALAARMASVSIGVTLNRSPQMP